MACWYQFTSFSLQYTRNTTKTNFTQTTDTNSVTFKQILPEGKPFFCQTHHLHTALDVPNSQPIIEECHVIAVDASSPPR